MKQVCKKIVFIGLSILILILFYGCQSLYREQEENLEVEEPKEIIIPVIFTVDPATNQSNNEQLVEEFNKEYKGIYKVEVEWMADTEAEYRSKIKRLNVTDELPAIITDIGFLPSFYQLLVKENRLLDLSSYLEKDKEWLELIEPQVLKTCTEEDGSIYLSVLNTSAFSGAGIFWNTKLFEQAGIMSFPSTWEEFWDCCELLLSKGITPLSLHTDGTAWAPMLFSTAIIGSKKEGFEFMHLKLPESYNNEIGSMLVDTLKKLFQYTTEDALNRDFDVAFYHFFNEETAMLPNGFWMLDRMGEEWNDHISFHAFPGNIIIASPEMSGWAISNTYPKEVQEGAVAFLRYRFFREYREKQQLLESSNKKLIKIEKEYLEVMKQKPILVPNYQIQWNTILQDQVFPEQIPNLIKGKLSKQQFIDAIEDGIVQYKNEQ